MVKSKTAFGDNGKSEIKSVLVFLAFALFLIPFFVGDVNALQQVGGTPKFELTPGDSDVFKWALKSDDKTESITIKLSANKDGAEFLHFPDSIVLEPLELVWIPITIEIPDDYPGGIALKPKMYATQFGEEGGAAKVNVRMTKTIYLNILPNAGTELSVDEVQVQEPQMDPEPSTDTVDEVQIQEPQMDPEPSTDTVDEVPETTEPQSVTQSPSKMVTLQAEIVESNVDSKTVTLQAEKVESIVDSEIVTLQAEIVESIVDSEIVTLQAVIVESSGEFTAAAEPITVDNQNIATSEYEYEISALIEENQRLTDEITEINEQVDYLTQLLENINLVTRIFS